MPKHGPPPDLTGFQRDLLVSILHEGPCKGLAIKAYLERFYKEELNHGRIYPNLDELVKKGLVEKRARDKRTNEYSFTTRGKRVLADYVGWIERTEVEIAP